MEFTDEAVNRVKKVIEDENDPSILGLRVSVMGGGCSGFQYGFSYVNVQEDDDLILEYDGVKIYIDSLSLMYLEEVTVDYEKTIMGENFVLRNPAETGRCGCGSSFSV